MFGKKRRPPSDKAPLFHCSFCSKSQEQVRKLIAGPNVYICDECIDICVDVVSEDRKDSTTAEQAAWPHNTSHICALCRLPLSMAEAIIVENRGLICRGCRGEIEAAIAREKVPPVT